MLLWQVITLKYIKPSKQYADLVLNGNSNMEYFCTTDENCPSERSKLIVDKNECVEACVGEYRFEFEDKSYNACPSVSIPWASTDLLFGLVSCCSIFYRSILTYTCMCYCHTH